ncbi:hypothetical protein C1645_825368 [Glomus cerebriforme]|uniref:Uncharacterized protein n=1 Tax=Glomus cerebriforme TaxID=658196 RepID=A0A397SSC4_9GLOM|nr:hypothetical protein C1645_825368 [Glomus cerebriforme]
MAYLEDIPNCNADTVSDIIIKHICQDGLDFAKCALWVTDNTSYMSGEKKGAVVLFNRKTSSNSTRISCALHIIQIILNNFEQKAFGTVSNNTSFSRKPHIYNLLYLTWKLHNGFHYNKYQLPLRSRWSYELQTVKQYLDRHSAHIEFANWFIERLENRKKPKSYLNDWHLFQSWLIGPKLNIQIKYGQLIALPPDRRAHEISYGFVINEEFETLFDKLELGIKNALDSFQKYFYHVILEKPWITPPSERFAQDLEDDKNNGIINDFSLNELLHLNDKISKENLDKLKEVRKQRNRPRRSLQKIQPQLFGPDIASELFKQMLSLLD